MGQRSRVSWWAVACSALGLVVIIVGVVSHVVSGGCSGTDCRGPVEKATIATGVVLVGVGMVWTWLRFTEPEARHHRDEVD